MRGYSSTWRHGDVVAVVGVVGGHPGRQGAAGTVGVVHVGELLRDLDLDQAVRHEEALEDLVAARALVLAIAEHSPGPWARAGACRGQVEVMFPTRGEPTEPAKALCASCPVHEPCSDWARTVPASQSGIIAGTSERARRDARRAGASLDAAA